MIIFFGSAGSGKSLQGQMLANSQGWYWLSVGQLLRDTNDEKVHMAQKKGELVTNEKVYQIIGDAFRDSADANKIVLDGFPRKLEQARWLIESHKLLKNNIELVIVLEVSRAEILKRLQLRGRVDDNPEAIDDRLRIYRKEIYPILGYFTEQGVNVVHIDGAGTPEQVHSRIMEELGACRLI